LPSQLAIDLTTAGGDEKEVVREEEEKIRKTFLLVSLEGVYKPIGVKTLLPLGVQWEGDHKAITGAKKGRSVRGGGVW
jgi:hypothetical protein